MRRVAKGNILDIHGINMAKATPQEMSNKKNLLDKIKSSMGRVDAAVDGAVVADVDDGYEGSGRIKHDAMAFGEVLEMAIDVKTSKDASEKNAKLQAMKDRASQKRKETLDVKNDIGIGGNSKQSKFSTRADHFLGDDMRAVNIVLNHKQSGIYIDGSDPCPRLLMGHPAYGKTCKRNAFEHFVNLQKKIREFRGDDAKKAPAWIIFNNDTSLIADRNIVTRLEELRPATGVASAYGFEKIRAHGRWYDITEADQSNIRGCYIQGAMDKIDWDFVVGSQFKQSPRYRIAIAHGPFVAIRGELFMTIDFSDAAEKYESGFYHYMAEFSMECIKRGLSVATVKTTAIQYDNLMLTRGTEQFETDQAIFTSRWQAYLPNAIPSLIAR